MPETEQARSRLARLMNDRRVDLGLRWTEVAEMGGVSAETLRAMRRTSAPLRDLTKAGIEKGLRWKRGSVDQVLAGGDPVPEARYDDAALQSIWELNLPEEVRLGMIALAERMREERERRNGPERTSRGA